MEQNRPKRIYIETEAQITKNKLVIENANQLGFKEGDKVKVTIDLSQSDDSKIGFRQ